jgi:hypothetical protein
MKRSESPINEAKKQKLPYWLGLLCLTPLIGAFLGLGLFTVNNVLRWFAFV